MRVFVTGATGFVGSHLVNALLERGDDVVCLVRDPARAKSLFTDVAPQLVRGDLSDRATLRAACAGADVIYHSAGLTTARNRNEFFAINAEGTKLVVEAARDAASDLTRFVYVSSQAAAGPSRKGHPRTENDPPLAVSNYGASKLAGEDAVRDSGLPWTIIRPCAVYGPGDKAFLTVFKLLRFGFMPVLGSTEQELSMIHIADLVGSLLVSVGPATLSETYFACHPQILTPATLSKQIRSALAPHKQTRPLVCGLPVWATRAVLAVTGAAAGLAGKSTFLSPDKGNEYVAEAWVCSPKKLERATGWRAQVAVEEGVRNTVSWYRANGWL